ncbi:hypothetical protein [Rhodococcus erythropolis]|uniref:Uncharacterized protein n=1 Tax=Rhodococcus erythropolis (strain PR4 / NBRC 100887) TaxID=234621 RepID=Q3L9H5_RHOE4|nr:hypothetical protein [Rhodococcus erythropolis]BAE46138.1 hypothetical protein RER_pREL1-01950 [Rhodococcus erythropolis PR4]
MEYPPETAIKSQFLVALDDTFQYLANSETSNSVRVNGFKMILSYIQIIEGSFSNCHLHNTIDNPSFAPEIDSIKSPSGRLLNEVEHKGSVDDEKIVAKLYDPAVRELLVNANGLSHNSQDLLETMAARLRNSERFLASNPKAQFTP